MEKEILLEMQNEILENFKEFEKRINLRFDKIEKHINNIEVNLNDIKVDLNSIKESIYKIQYKKLKDNNETL